MALRINHKDNSLQLDKVTAPANPPAGTVVLYVDTTSGNLTTKDETGATEELGGAGVPGGSDTHVQFNDSNVFGGEADFTYDKTTRTLVVGTAGEGIINSGAAQALTVKPGLGSSQMTIIGAQAATGTGGATLISGGWGQTGKGGLLSLKAGTTSGANTDGAQVQIQAGAPTGVGLEGSVEIIRNGGTGGATPVRFRDGTGANYVALKAPAAAGVNRTWVLPSTDPATSVGLALVTDGTGNLSFSDNFVKVGGDTITGELFVDGNVISHITINTKTANYELLLTDDGKMIPFNSASALTLTIPANTSVAFPTGTEILIEREGSGTVTVAITDDTLHSAGSLVTLAAQYSTATLIKKSATVWILAGDLA